MSLFELMQEQAQKGSCDLMGVEGVIVQIVLAITAFSILVVKRGQEVPQRPFKIWFLDVSKQLLSQIITHMGNVFFSILISRRLTSLEQNADGPDQCNYYLVTIVIDTSIGVFIACNLLQYIESIFAAQGQEQLKSGNYYKTVLISKVEVIQAEDGDRLQVPTEQIEFIEIYY